MEYKSFEPGIEVSGESLGAVIDGFRRYPSVAMKYLVKFGVITSQGGASPAIDRAGWYPLDAWLAAYEAIAKEVGVNSLFSIGKSIPENIVLPPHVTDIHSLFASIDAAYHMNHRKNGVVMFNPATGTMLEGIGHYGYRAVPNERRIVSVCANPWPCEFDRGLITAMATRFEPLAKTAHDNEAPCRKKGAESCTYIVAW